ncbi:MAG: hypothetical protein AAGE65_14725 [Planctomycetota bacterium]
MSASGSLSQSVSLLRSASSAASSVLKTSVLRRGRVSLPVLERRLDTCRSCPGGHARFKADGSLHTCGPMLDSMRGKAGGTCGCVLNRKALDAAQDCPFGHWPKVDPAQVEPEPKPAPARVPAVARAATPTPGLVAPARPKLWVPGQDEPALPRRQFLGRSAAAVAGAGFAGVGLSTWGPQRVMAQSEPGYIRVSPCQDGAGTHVACSDVVGRQTDEIFAATDGKCYSIASSAIELNASQPVTPGGSWYAPGQCQQCDDDTVNCPDCNGVPIGDGPCEDNCLAGRDIVVNYSIVINSERPCCNMPGDPQASLNGSVNLTYQGFRTHQLGKIHDWGGQLVAEGECGSGDLIDQYVWALFVCADKSFRAGVGNNTQIITTSSTCSGGSGSSQWGYAENGTICGSLKDDDTWEASVAIQVY